MIIAARGDGAERRFIVFYHDYREGGRGSIKPEERIKLDLVAICERMAAVLCCPDNFFGVVDEFGRTLQFVVERDLSITAELVLQEKCGSMSASMPLFESIKLVARAPQSLITLNIPNAIFRPWQPPG